MELKTLKGAIKHHFDASQVFKMTSLEPGTIHAQVYKGPSLLTDIYGIS